MQKYVAIVVSSIVLGALFITGCGAGADPGSEKGGGVEADSSASPQTGRKEISGTDRAIINEMKLGSSWDVDHGVVVPKTRYSAILDKGIIVKTTDEQTKKGSFSLIKFDGNKVWTSDDAGYNFSRLWWDGKEYLLATTLAVSADNKETLAKQTDTIQETIHVFDTETGKSVYTMSASDPVAGSVSPSEWKYAQPWNSSYTEQNGIQLTKWANTGPAKTSVVVATKTINPLTGATIKEMSPEPKTETTAMRIAGIDPRGDFITSRVLGPGATPGTASRVIRVPGLPDLPNYRPLGNTNGRYTLATTDQFKNGAYSIVDLKTNTILVDEIKCSHEGNEFRITPNGRYLIAGNAVIDTESKKVYCGDETDSQNELKPTLVSNDGTIFGISNGKGAEAFQKIRYTVDFATGKSEAVRFHPSAFTKDNFGLFVDTQEENYLPVLGENLAIVQYRK